jgi:hypothetical protein
MHLAAIVRIELERRRERLFDLRAAMDSDPAAVKSIADGIEKALQRLASE